jgi:hypothetical protein
MTYSIAMFDVEGTHRLESFDSYSEADLHFDGWCSTYPHAWLEIINDQELEQIAHYD